VKPERIASPFRYRITECDTCGGDGTVVEFRRWAGEYQGGEPVEVRCPDCKGSGELGEASCTCCDRVLPLDDDGECADCSGLVEVRRDETGGIWL